MTHGHLATLIGLAILTVGLCQPVEAEETYKVRLSTVPKDATMLDTVTGSGLATAVLSGNKLTISGKFEGLAGPATIARLHRGRRGIRGPAVAELIVTKAQAGTLTGTIELTAGQTEDLREGRFYVQIHSEKAPDGNLWGWLLR
jgi:CHRD domain